MGETPAVLTNFGILVKIATVLVKIDFSGRLGTDRQNYGPHSALQQLPPGEPEIEDGFFGHSKRRKNRCANEYHFMEITLTLLEDEHNRSRRHPILEIGLSHPSFSVPEGIETLTFLTLEFGVREAGIPQPCVL